MAHPEHPLPSEVHCRVSLSPPSEATVHLVGELDRSTAPDCAAQLDDVLGSPWTRVRIDMSEVSFIDAGGMAAVEHFVRRAHQLGRRAAVVRPSPPAARLIVLLHDEWLIDPGD